MTNQYTKIQLNEQEIIDFYTSGNGLNVTAKHFSTSVHRIRPIIASSCGIRTISDSLAGNQRNKKHHISKKILERLYVTERRSIHEIEATTGIPGIIYYLRKYNIETRGYSETRIGNGDVLSPEARERVALASTGEKHWNWKGGLTPEQKKFYRTKVWKTLSQQCKRRDNYVCQRCNKILLAKKLRAHHIIPRLEGGPDTLENLITYCNPCHRKVHMGH